jgi:hypothetical protein
MRNPLPAAVQVTPVVADQQRYGPTPIVVPNARVGVVCAGVTKHCPPVHALYEPSALSVADRGGVVVWQWTDVRSER